MNALDRLLTACAVWAQVDAPELSSGPMWEIQEVSRVGAQGVTSKSKLLAPETIQLRSGGSQVDSEAAKLIKVAPALPGPKPVLRGPLRCLERRCNALLRPSPLPVAAKTSLLP